MKHRRPPMDEASQRDLRRLLDEISTGTILDLEGLEERDFELLRAHFGEEADLEALMDRLRGGEEQAVR